MNLHEVLMEMGSKHSHIKNKGYSDLLSFNLKEKSIKNGKIILMQNGNIIPQKINFADGREIELEDDLGDTEEEFFNGLEERFIEYYLSCPTESDRFVRSNFVSKAGDKLTYEEFMKGGNRNEKRYELEWWVLANALKNNIKWPNDQHWFWQSTKYPQLILYKEFL